jgi:hypothetical protein
VRSERPILLPEDLPSRSVRPLLIPEDLPQQSRRSSRAKDASDGASGLAIGAGLALSAAGVGLGVATHGLEQDIAYGVAVGGAYATSIATFGFFVRSAATLTAKLAIGLVGLTAFFGTSGELVDLAETPYSKRPAAIHRVARPEIPGRSQSPGAP